MYQMPVCSNIIYPLLMISWLFLLHDRAEVFETFKKLTEIKNQFSITPKIFRSDNALE